MATATSLIFNPVLLGALTVLAIIWTVANYVALRRFGISSFRLHQSVFLIVGVGLAANLVFEASLVLSAHNIQDSIEQLQALSRVVRVVGSALYFVVLWEASEKVFRHWRIMREGQNASP